MKTFTSILFTLLFVSLSYGQGRNERLGNREFESYNYTGAIERFERISDKSPEVMRKLAFSHHFMGNINQAESYYAALAASEERSPQDVWDHARVLMELERYEQAKEQLELFYELAPDDPRTRRFQQAGDFVADIRGMDTFIKVTNLDMNNLHQDFGITFFDGKAVFASSRQTVERPRNPWSANQLPFLLPFEAEVAGDGQLGTPSPFMSDFFTGKYHTGPVAFSPGGDRMAVTVNYDPKTRGGETLNLQLLVSTLQDDGQWGELTPVPFNNPGYSVGQAAFSPDGRTLFFVSDMPGGQGGTDIYRVAISPDGSFGTPENLRQVNTQGNEMFPYMHPGGQFYFSSDGHPGLGGLDIFRADYNDGRISGLANMGTPINSPADDFAIVLMEDGQTGYFSSRRAAGRGSDDIYRFHYDMPEPRLALSKSPEPAFFRLPGEEIAYTITLRNTGQVPVSDIVVEDPLTGLNATIAQLNPGESRQFNETYVVQDADMEALQVVNTATANGMAPDGSPVSVTTQATIPLREFIEVGPIFFDFDKSNIRPDAALELDKVVELMNQYPNMVVEVASHTDCRGTHSYNDLLSEARARATIGYIRERISDPERISGQGYGKTQLTNRCDCEEVPPCNADEHQANRRSEFRIVRLR